MNMQGDGAGLRPVTYQGVMRFPQTMGYTMHATFCVDGNKYGRIAIDLDKLIVRDSEHHQLMVEADGGLYRELIWLETILMAIQMADAPMRLSDPVNDVHSLFVTGLAEFLPEECATDRAFEEFLGNR